MHKSRRRCQRVCSRAGRYVMHWLVDCFGFVSSGEFVLASLAASSLHVTRLYGFRLRIHTQRRLQNVRAEVEVALTERLFARWTICNVCVCGLQCFVSLAASLFCQLCGENIAELLTCLCIPGTACRGKARHQPSEVFMFTPKPHHSPSFHPTIADL